jgi:hypothetical protein
VRKAIAGRCVLTTAAIVVAAFWAAHAQERGATPAGGDQPGQIGQAQQGRGRGRGPAEAPLPTPRLPDGTVNLGRVPGEKGIWNVPYITNMGMRVVDDSGKSLAPPPEAGRGRGAGAPLGGGEGTAGGGRGGTKSEPWMPFQPWAAAVYNYNSANQSKDDPEGYCLPPGGPRLMSTPYPA